MPCFGCGRKSGRETGCSGIWLYAERKPTQGRTKYYYKRLFHINKKYGINRPESSSLWPEIIAEIFFKLIPLFCSVLRLSAEGIRVFVENQAEFETSAPYRTIIERQAEAFYRIVNQKGRILPSSDYVVKKSIPVSIGNHHRHHVDTAQLFLIGIKPAGVEKLMHKAADSQPLHLYRTGLLLGFVFLRKSVKKEKDSGNRDGRE